MSKVKDRQRNIWMFKHLTFFYCWLPIAVCMLFSGCGGAQTQTLSPIHSRAMEYKQKGAKAAEKGDYDNALGYYMEALKLDRSIENNEGIAINVINISVILQKKGDVAKAGEFIDIALSIPDVNDSIKSEAAYEKAKIFLKENDTRRADEWVNRSLAIHKGIREGSRWNLLGKIRLIEGKYAEALSAANTALKLNSGNKQRAEESNSLRLLAEINELQGNYEMSGEFYAKSLVIDKEIGDSRKIAATLRGLGSLSLRKGSIDDAINYYTRAYDVSVNASDKEGIVQAARSLSDAYRKSGNENKADEVLKFIEKDK